MNGENDVIFKGTKDGITILLSPEAEYNKIKTLLAKKVAEASKFFDGVKTSIAFKGHELTEKQEKELLDIICEESNMHITFVKTETEDSTQLTALLSQEMQQHNITKFHKGSVRSGQSVEYDGSIVIIGDINPGGIVKSSGNIIVLGQLKGIAHAGCNGMENAFVAAIYMAPVQLRIADIITRFPEENKKGPKPAEYAYIEDGQIYVMTLA